MGLLTPVTPTEVVETGADRDAIRSALSILFAPGEFRELRSPRGDDKTRWRIVSGDDLDAATDAAYWLSDGPVYWSLNPIAADARSASKATVLRRAWLLIDLDTVRPSKDVGATEAERLRAYVVAAAILAHLETLGWPEPVFVDSGNGYHLLYRIDLPNDALSHQIIKGALEGLASRFDTEHVKVDTAVHDAPRISRLPGTANRKGADTPERPHRLAAIVCAPVALHPVPVGHLQALAAKPAEATKKGKPLAPVTGLGGGNLGRFVEVAVNRECERVSIAPAGGRNNALNRAAFSLSQMSTWPEMDVPTTQWKLRMVGIAVGLPEHEAIGTIRSGWTSGSAEPRKRPEPDRPVDVAEALIRDGKSLIKWASKVVPKKVEWLWPRRIPLGKLTTFAGQGGLGKTFVLCDIAARISKGAEWPFCGGECAEQGKVLFISAEDDEDDTLVPRLMECKADLTQIAFLTAEVQTGFTMAALKLLTSVLDEMGDDVRLVVIDPPTSFLDGIDDHSNGELRSILTPYKEWCAKRRVAVILNTHVNKSVGGDVDAAARVMGSVAWVNAVRTAHLFMRNEQEPDKVAFAAIKTNVGKLPSALTYRIRPTTGDMADVEWISEDNRSADQILKGNKQPKAKNAAEVLIDMFNRRSEWPSDLFWKELDAHGVKRTAFDQVRETLQIPKSRRTSQPDGGVEYVWYVRPDWPHLAGNLGGNQQIANSDDKPF